MGLNCVNEFSVRLRQRAVVAGVQDHLLRSGVTISFNCLQNQNSVLTVGYLNFIGDLTHRYNLLNALFPHEAVAR